MRLTLVFFGGLGYDKLGYDKPCHRTPGFDKRWVKHLLGIACCLVAPVGHAASLTAEQLVNNAYADGGLIATASTCRVTKDTLNPLIYQQKKAALDLAKQHQLPFTSKDYDDYVVSGFQATLDALQQYSEQSDALEQVCASIHEKIAQKLQSTNKPP